MIIAPNLGPEIMHEVIHSIDPNENKRLATEQVLEEFGSYFLETYVPRIYEQRTVHTDGSGNTTAPVLTRREVFVNIPQIEQTLLNKLYINTYARHFGSEEAYIERVKLIGGVLQDLTNFMSLPDIHKAILNAKSFQELDHLLTVRKREAGTK